MCKGERERGELNLSREMNKIKERQQDHCGSCCHEFFVVVVVVKNNSRLDEM